MGLIGVALVLSAPVTVLAGPSCSVFSGEDAPQPMVGDQRLLTENIVPCCLRKEHISWFTFVYCCALRGALRTEITHFVGNVSAHCHTETHQWVNLTAANCGNKNDFQLLFQRNIQQTTLARKRIQAMTISTAESERSSAAQWVEMVDGRPGLVASRSCRVLQRRSYAERERKGHPCATDSCMCAQRQRCTDLCCTTPLQPIESERCCA